MTQLQDYTNWTKSVWFSSDSEKLDDRALAIMSLGLAGETGEVMELLKKRVRDGKYDEEHLKSELGDVIYYWAMLCNYFNISPDEVLEANKKKFYDRQARGTLRGSGDDR